MYPNCPTPPLQKIYKFKGGYLKKMFVQAVSFTPHAQFFASENRAYLGEFEAEFKKALASKSLLLFDEKQRRLKIL
jgi:hypothetical protein